MQNNWLPYKNNILIAPKSKEKIIGDTAKYYLYGEVLDVGSEVKDIKKGDIIAYTLWGLNEILEANGTKHYLIQDNPDFILAVRHENAS